MALVSNQDYKSVLTRLGKDLEMEFQTMK